MMNKNVVNNFSLNIATVNGSGSQSANTIIARTLFRMGLPVGAKNLFPSNIAGLATWFTIRVHGKGFVGRKRLHDIVIAKNLSTLKDDIAALKSGGYFIYDQEFKIDPSQIRDDVKLISIPYRELVKEISESIKMRKLLTNMVYVGLLSELLELDQNALKSSLVSQFKNKNEIIEINQRAIDKGIQFVKENLQKNDFIFKVKSLPDGNKNHLLIDGNSAAAIGALCGGCTFLSWYPITPSSSLAENFQTLADEFRTDGEKKKYASLQAEDELGAISMVIGAGWAGSRAMTATSGPGLSLMAEAAGLSYFAEVPAVIWDVQRAGPSTGLPTRTLQGDILASAFLSHGDTEHVLLIPGSPQECFEMARIAFDTAEELQTIVIVLSDLDLGMNLYISPEFEHNSKPYSRGKVLSANDLNKLTEFARYKDVDGDGIGYRTLPGTAHPLAAYFTRGTSHTETSAYSENAENFNKLLNRLKFKLDNYVERLPKPILTGSSTDNGVIAYGSTDSVMAEALSLLNSSDMPLDYLRIRSFPFSSDVLKFLENKKNIFVVEQNRDAQLASLLKIKFPKHAGKLVSVLNYDGLPITAESIFEQIEKKSRMT